MKLVRDVIVAGNAVTKGVYRERYGKCERRVGESGSSDMDEDPSEKRRDVKDENNDRCRFQMSMKLEKTDVRTGRSSRGWGVSREPIMGVKKCYNIHEQRTYMTREETYGVDEFEAIDICSLCFIELLNDLASFGFRSSIYGLEAGLFPSKSSLRQLRRSRANFSTAVDVAHKGRNW